MAFYTVAVLTVAVSSVFAFASTSASPASPQKSSLSASGSAFPTHSTYLIPAQVQNRTAHARFDLETPGGYLGIPSRQSLDAPMLDAINNSVFDWWYFDAVAEDDPRQSLVLTFFSSSADAFPFLETGEDSVLIAFAWASFQNGSSWAGYVPAKVARVDIMIGGVKDYPANSTWSSGVWEGTGFRWDALKEDLSSYEVFIDSPELSVRGKLNFTSGAPPHIPCGVGLDATTLEVAPHIGWVNLVPDAVASVDVTIRDTQLKFQGAAYHDKNWSDRNFTESVRSWYWGHGRLGPYAIVWFSYLAIDDPTNTPYVSSYVSRDGEILVSNCNASLLAVRPTGNPNTTGARYPPFVGDIPDGFKLDFVLDDGDKRLRVNVSTESIVAGDGDYYLRWTGSITGEVVEVRMNSSTVCESSLAGVAVFEKFYMLQSDAA